MKKSPVSFMVCCSVPGPPEQRGYQRTLGELRHAACGNASLASDPRSHQHPAVASDCLTGLVTPFECRGGDVKQEAGVTFAREVACASWR